MSDYAASLLRAIEIGDKEQMATAVSTALDAKVSDALDAKKIEIAQRIYGYQAPGEDDEQDSGETVEISADESEEDGTEEV